MTKHMYEAVISMINYMNMMCIDRVSVHIYPASWETHTEEKTTVSTECLKKCRTFRW